MNVWFDSGDLGDLVLFYIRCGDAQFADGPDFRVWGRILFQKPLVCLSLRAQRLERDDLALGLAAESTMSSKTCKKPLKIEKSRIGIQTLRWFCGS